VIAQLVGDLFALPGRKTQPLREKFQVKPEFLFETAAFWRKPELEAAPALGAVCLKP